jgi:hypothetical protein
MLHAGDHDLTPTPGCLCRHLESALRAAKARALVACTGGGGGGTSEGLGLLPVAAAQAHWRCVKSSLFVRCLLLLRFHVHHQGSNMTGKAAPS